MELSRVGLTNAKHVVVGDPEVVAALVRAAADHVELVTPDQQTIRIDPDDIMYIEGVAPEDDRIFINPDHVVAIRPG